MKYAVCIHTAPSSFAMWIVEEAENAREAVENVKKEFTVHKVLGVYKEQEDWKWK